MKLISICDYAWDLTPVFRYKSNKYVLEKDYLTMLNLFGPKGIQGPYGIQGPKGITYESTTDVQLKRI